MSKVRDERIKVSNEVLGGMKVIRTIIFYVFLVTSDCCLHYLLYVFTHSSSLCVSHLFYTSLFLSFFQVIKFQAWEGEFEKRINDIRDREMQLLKR